MDTNPPAPTAFDDTPLSPLEARVLGCLIEKEFATPDIYPLSLNSLLNACNQRSNRAPIMAVESRETEVAIELLRRRRLVAQFGGADARVPKFKQTFDFVYPVPVEARALLAELLLRGPQTAAGLRGNAERLTPLPEPAGVEELLGELAARPTSPLVRKLPRQPGQKEARWAQLLTGEPAAEEPGVSAEPVTVRLVLPTEAEQRLATLEAEVARLGAELLRLKAALGE
jgi:uncharacterized protein YceH (UPF0502 family)